MLDAPIHQTTFTFSTHDLPDQERFNAWRELVSATHEVRLTASPDEPFQVDASIVHLENLIVSSGRYSGQIFSRTTENIRRDQLDHYGLFAQGEGCRVVQFGEMQQVLYPGDVILFDMQQPVESIASDGTSGTLYLPRAIVEAVIPGISGHHCLKIHGDVARLVAHHIHVTGNQLSDQSSLPLAFMANATRDLALACLLGAIDGHVETGGPIDEVLRRRVEHHIDAWLQDPDLSVMSICNAFGISRSTLYRIFDHPYGVASFIKQRRLIRIHSILVSNDDRRSLSDIAQDYGFRTGAHFSREFRRTFGYPPGELRGSGRIAVQASSRADTLDVLFHTLSA